MTNRLRTKQQSWLILGLMVCDALMIMAGWMAAIPVRNTLSTLFAIVSPNAYVYPVLVYCSIPFWWGLFALHHLYDLGQLLGGPQEYANVTKGCSFGFIVVVLLSVMVRGDLARGWLVLGWLLSIISVGTGRFVIRRLVYVLRRRWGFYIHRALIVGCSEQARAIAQQLLPAQSSGVAIVGFLDDFLPLGTPVLAGLSVLGTPRQLPYVAQREQVDEVILVPNSMSAESFQSLVRAVSLRQEPFQIRISPGFYEILTTDVRVSYRNHIPLLEIERTQIAGFDAWLKNSLDYGLGTLLLLLSLPLIAILALIARATSRQPVFQKVAVLGRNGQRFFAWEFRTARSPTDSSCPPAPLASLTHQSWGERGAEETGSWGERFRYGLDVTGLSKLPRLFNVVLGQMSLVGPPCIPPAEAPVYEPWLPSLLTLKPGVTSPRVAAARPEMPLEDEIRLILYYARNYSIWFDLQIIFQTVMRLLRGDRPRRNAPPQSLSSPKSADNELWMRSSATSPSFSGSSMPFPGAK